jgi:uncharacterized protein YaiI (UPF0178 family)
VEADDIVITGDIRSIEVHRRREQRSSTAGRPFTEDNIGGVLATRDLLTQLREGGEKTKGPAPFHKSDRSLFLQELDKMVQAIRRRQ